MSWRDDALRISTFVLHFASAVFFTSVSFSCSRAFQSESYTRTVTDKVGYLVVMNASCADPSSRECFFGQPQAYDVLQGGLEWNVFALLAVFEWLSASYALFYLRDISWAGSEAAKNGIDNACQLWNIVGIFIFMPYSFPLTLLQAELSALALMFTIAMQCVIELRSGIELDHSRNDECQQHGGAGGGDDSEETGLYPHDQGDSGTAGGVVYCYPSGEEDDEAYRVTEEKVVSYGAFAWRIPHTRWLRGPEAKGGAKPSPSTARVALHYSEYCTSASFLLVAVLALFVADPYAWSSIVALTGILLCNLTGIAAHNCRADQHRQTPTFALSLDWTKEGNHFKLFMLHSWSALLLSICIIFYLGRQDLVNSSIPVWVEFILWNLLITYTLFGVWATICYALAGTRSDAARFNAWMERLDYGLTILSVAAKLPIAFTVYYGLIKRPGGDVC